MTEPQQAQTLDQEKPQARPRGRSPTAKLTKLSTFKPHPRNYRSHPEAQLLHIEASLQQHGPYRNVVAARDGTILAGHGVVEAACRLGWAELPALLLDLDPASPAALKILAADNELGRFAEDDDRALTELLREIKEVDVEGLLGTGYDEAQLAALLLVTRPASEVPDVSAAAEWSGAEMPSYEEGTAPIRLVITFKSEEDRKAFAEEFGIGVDKTSKLQTWSTRWPLTEREDVGVLRFEPEAPAP